LGAAFFLTTAFFLGAAFFLAAGFFLAVFFLAGFFAAFFFAFAMMQTPVLRGKLARFHRGSEDLPIVALIDRGSRDA
jgi:hypothetical protein